jgi:ribosomal protein S11
MARQPTKKTGAKKQKRNVPNGVAFIQSTFNNTIVTISDTNGDVLSWASAGSSGLREPKREHLLPLRPPLKVPLAERPIRGCVRLK